MDSSGWRCIQCGAVFVVHVASCSSCFESGTLLRIGQRQLAAVDAVPEVTTARELAKAAWTLVTSAAYPSLRLGRGALVVVFGPPGSGKSTFATRLLDGFEGAVALQSVEESVGPSLHDRLERCAVRREDFLIIGRASVDQLVECVRTRRVSAVVVDSVQLAAFTAEELRHLLVVLPDLRVLIAVSQVNKQGRIEGRERLLHEADVAVSCDAMTWRVEKSRYQVVGVNGGVLPPRETFHANP
jgi:predicted ATP-dependent serine protease